MFNPNPDLGRTLQLPETNYFAKQSIRSIYVKKSDGAGI